jgi:hypothetical protein
VEPLAGNVIPLTLKPGALRLQHIELEGCCLRTMELRTLLQACSGLKSFLYSSGSRETGLWGPSPTTVIELLEPFQDSLEKLSLNINVDRCEDWPDRRYQPKLIGSLAHMTALTVSDTVPEIWHGVGNGQIWEFAEVAHASSEGLFYFRLPPNLETLVFSLSQVADMISLKHLEDLIRTRAEILPNLRDLHVGVSPDRDDYKKEMEDLLESLEPYSHVGPQPLQVIISPVYLK